MGAASSRWCVVITIVRSLCRKPASSSTICRALSTSMLEKGSSSSSSSGDGSSTRASEVRWRMPCEYCPSVRFRCGIEAHLAQGFVRREAVAAGIEAGEVAQILLRGQLVVEHGRVAHVADARARLVRLESPKTRDRAEARPQQPGQNAQQRRFAGAVFAQQHVAAARFKRRPMICRSAAKLPKSFDT